MVNRLYSAAVIATSILVLSSVAIAAPVSNSTVAELAAHRIEKLVTLKKIDAGFMNRFEALEVSSIPQGGVGKPSFKVVAEQQADEGKEAMKVELVLDEKGKALSHKVIEGEEATKPTAWPSKDPVTLTEVALHYVEDNAAKPEIAKFNKSLKTVTITPANLNGANVAQVAVTSNDAAETLYVAVSLDGKVITAEVKK